ncbi:hypothetical protein COBT_001327, partial [Conglomerata obtusa]
EDMKSNNSVLLDINLEIEGIKTIAEYEKYIGANEKNLQELTEMNTRFNRYNLNKTPIITKEEAKKIAKIKKMLHYIDY